MRGRMEGMVRMEVRCGGGKERSDFVGKKNIIN